MPKYTIITPMYNSFDLMGRYFESLINQTYNDFEVVIVDDCSTDGSYGRLAEYARASFLDIHIYKTEKNSGPGNARNMGMDAARGEWITFIDNDDWVETYLFERIDSIINANEADCVIYDYYIQRRNKKTAARSMYCGEAGMVSLSECMVSVRNHTIGKFYKLTDCMKEKIRFPELRRCEDIAFVARAIDACGSVYYLNEPMYYYWQRSNSLSNDTSLDETDLLNAFRILEENLGMKYPAEIMEKSVPDLLYGVVLTMCKARKPNEEICNFIAEYERRYPAWYKCSILNHLGRSKKCFLKYVRRKNVAMLKLMAGIHSYLLQ